MTQPLNHIAIIGAGPAGSALACFARQRGISVTLFDNEKRPDLLVGESLIPAVMPIIQRLGLEDQVAKISTKKRGAALRHHTGTRVDFEFRRFGRQFPNYAYNIPRPQFDDLIRSRAVELGARVVAEHAKLNLEPDCTDRQIRLSQPTLDAAGLTAEDHPDLIVDATGRTRLISRLLKLSARRGPRKDVAHFAHFERFDSDSELPGQVVLSVLEHGWSWQIPLGNRTSVGVVIDQDSAQQYGRNAAERLNNIIQANPLLHSASKGSRRISEVKTYANYQLISEQASGPGWLLLGDALGFVDPMLSPGVFMALESAALADKHVLATGTQTSGSDLYFREVLQWHEAWGELIEYFYDGRILTIGEMRNKIRARGGLSLSRVAEPIVSRVLAQMVGGIATRSRFNQRALMHTCQHLVRDEQQCSSLAIQSCLAKSDRIAA